MRRTEARRPRLWARIRIVLTRDELGFPSFWQLQVTGSVGLYLLVLLSVLPYRNPGEFRHQTIFCATVFVISCFLRPVCRSLLRRSLPWLSLEIRAFGWSAAYGAVATFLSELVKLRAVRPIWPTFWTIGCRLQSSFFFGAHYISALSCGSSRRTKGQG